MVLKCLAEVCLKLTYRYLFKADHVPGDTWSGAFFGPRGIILLHIKYQGPRPYGFRQEEYFPFFSPKLVYVKHVSPGAGHF